MGAIRATQDSSVAISKVYEQEQGHKASNTVVFGVNPVDSNTITLNGTVFTYRDTPSVANDVQVGADISTSVDNLLAEALPTEATYTKSGTDSIFIEYGVIGVAGNDYTIACNFTSVPSNLEGGSDTPDADWVDNTPSIDYKLPEIGTSAYYDGATEESTSTALKTNTPIAENDNVRLYNATDGVVEGSLGAVSSSSSSNDTVGTHDIFGDGSAVATYNLDGNANDLGGNYDGTATDVTYDTGKFGQAGVFNGNSSTIDISVTSESIEAAISFWMDSNDDSDNVRFICESSISGDYMVHTGGDAGAGGIRLSKNGETVDFSNIFTSGSWGHYVAVFKTGEAILYADGNLVGSGTHTSATNTLDISYLGERGGSNYVFNGQIDQVRIFNRALTSDEVTALYNEQATKYTADISSLSLTQAPTKAYKDTSVSVSTVTEANAGRCIAQDEVLTKVSSTLTNFTGTNTISGLIESGDSIQIDGTTDVVCSDVVETDNGDGTFQYDCTIPEQSTAPTSAKVLDRSTTTAEVSDVYDDATGKFTKTYNKIDKQGRAFKYKIEADEGTEVSKVTIPMNKEG